MRFSDPQKFTIISAFIILIVSLATGYTASVFFRHAMIARSLAGTHDFLRSIAREQEAEGNLSAWDLENYSENTAKQHLEHSFFSITHIPDFVTVKVFKRDQTIVWSSATELIGTKQTHHAKALERVFSDDVPAAFNPVLVGSNENNLIEYYVPIGLGANNSPVAAVISIYRLSASIDSPIQEGFRLIWLVTGLGGIILYVALYRLFMTVHRERDKISSAFEKFSADSKQLFQIEKLSAMGQMVTEIAHQLNNPLVGVINLTELAQREISNEAHLKELLLQIRTAGERCRDYVQRVLQLNQPTSSVRQTTDLRQLLHETVGFFQQSFGRDPLVTVETPAESLTCEVDPILIRNALFNLIHNAAQADQIGPIVVSLARERHDANSGYGMSVSDRGPGLKPEVTDKLFTPFFTTRTNGTGLGLSVAQHIAILHGGTIKAENRPDGGSRFTIWIPDVGANSEI